MADTRQEMTASQRQMASFVSDHLHLLETHRSLFHFKQKFHPSWESRYIGTLLTREFFSIHSEQPRCSQVRGG